MANFYNANTEFLPSLGNLEIPVSNTNSVEMQSNFHNRPRLEAMESIKNRSGVSESNSSNVTSFDDILRDIIETSKNHMMNQMQHQPIAQSNANAIPYLYSPENLYQNLNFPNICPPFSQPMNVYPHNYNPINMHYANSSINNVPYDNYETLIETIYEDANDRENLTNTSIKRESNMHENQFTKINFDKGLQNENHQQLSNLEGNEQQSQEMIFSQPFDFQTSSKEKLRNSQQYVNSNNNQITQPQAFQIPFENPLYTPPKTHPIPTQQLTHNVNEVKVFCPKILSLEANVTCNSLNKTSALSRRNLSTSMPPPTFSVSKTSAFNSYRKKNQKSAFPSNYVNVIQPSGFQQMTNKENVVYQIREEPSNVYLVSDESIRSGQPDWIIEKSYVTSDMISVRPPMQTKRTVERAKEAAINDLFAIDFASLDTSSIFISTIQIKSPLHKKRKQDIKILEGFENIDFEEILLSNKLYKTTIQPIVNEGSSQSNKDESCEKNDLPKQIQRKNVIKTNSDTDDEIEMNLRSMLSPVDPNINNTSDNEKSSSHELSKNEENILPKSDCGYGNEDDLSEIGSLEAEVLQIKSLKCEICNKIFKSTNTLTRHKKKCDSNITTNRKIHKEGKNSPGHSDSPHSLKNENIPIPSSTTKIKQSEEINENNDGEENKTISTCRGSNLNKYDLKETIKKELKYSNKKNERKSSSGQILNKKQTISDEKHKAYKKVTKRRTSTNIAIDDAKSDQIENNDGKGKRKTRSNIISYKE